jgi:hypothetical protein
MPDRVLSETPGTAGEVPPPVALFKNSLRLWQARWKARQDAGAAEPAVRTGTRPRKGRKAGRTR